MYIFSSLKRITTWDCVIVCVCVYIYIFNLFSQCVCTLELGFGLTEVYL